MAIFGVHDICTAPKPLSPLAFLSAAAYCSDGLPKALFI